MTECRRPNCPNKRGRGRRGYCQKHYALTDGGYVDATESREHLAALRAAGYSLRDVAEKTGLDRETLRKLGQWTDANRVTIGTHKAITAIPIPDGYVPGGNQDIPAIGTRRRLQALQAAGYSQPYIAAELGVTQQCVGLFMRKEFVSGVTASRVAQLFSRLQLTTGPSKRAAGWAQRRNWAPPLAWDEDTIDDPNARPNLGEKKKSDFLAEYEEMLGWGLTHGQIATRLGILPDTLYQKVRRHQRGRSNKTHDDSAGSATSPGNLAQPVDLDAA